MNEVRQYEEGPYVLRYLYDRRKFLLLVAVLSGLISIGVTAMLPERFTSEGVVFPPGESSFDRMIENPHFGYHVQADRLIQIGQSAAMKDSLAKMHDLYRYYKIDTENKDARFLVHKHLSRDLKFDKTRYLSVVISASTNDPELSAHLANSAIDLLDYYWEDLFKRSVRNALAFAEEQYMEKNRQVLGLVDSIQALRSQNANQSMQLLSEQLAIKSKEINNLMNRFSQIREKGDFYDLGAEVGQLNEQLIEGKYQRALEKGKMNVLEETEWNKDTSYFMAKGRYQGSEENEAELRKRISGLKTMEKEYTLINERIGREWDRYHELKHEYDVLAHTYQPRIETALLSHLENRYDTEMLSLQEIQEKYELAKRYFLQPMPGLFVVDRAEPIYRRSSPSFRLNLLIAVIASLVVVIVIDLFRLRLKETLRRSSTS